MSRGDPKSTGLLIRGAVEPMARHLGVDYDASYSAPPATNEERVLYALRCGLSLIIDYAYPDHWETMSPDGSRSKRDCRKAAKYFQEALQQSEGQEGIAWAAQGYGRAMADFWRRAADRETQTGKETADDPRSGLLISASYSQSVAKLIVQDFSVEDPHEVLKEVASAEDHRAYDPENADAMADLRDYAARAGVTMQALALTVAPQFPTYEATIVTPVMSFNMTFNTDALANWAIVGEYWANLWKTPVLGYEEMTQVIATKHASGSSVD
jgi:hypothetical protein